MVDDSMKIVTCCILFLLFRILNGNLLFFYCFICGYCYFFDYFVGLFFIGASYYILS